MPPTPVGLPSQPTIVWGLSRRFAVGQLRLDTQIERLHAGTEHVALARASHLARRIDIVMDLFVLIMQIPAFELVGQHELAALTARTMMGKVTQVHSIMLITCARKK